MSSVCTGVGGGVVGGGLQESGLCGRAFVGDLHVDERLRQDGVCGRWRLNWTVVLE